MSACGIYSYFDQLVDAAAKAGVDLRLAALHAGISDTTYYRWRGGQFSPQEDTSARVMLAIGQLAQAAAVDAAA